MKPGVRLFHWRSEEAKPLIAMLRAAGYTVDYPGDKMNGSFRTMRLTQPVAALIDLTRMPSHGRYVAAAIRGVKAIRHIPIVFLDGEPEKVERIRKDFPDAVYTPRPKLLTVLKRVKPLANPVTLPHTIAAPRDRTVAQKLGIKEGARVAVIDAPANYAKALGPLPADAVCEEDPDEVLPVTLWFVHDLDLYLAGLRRMRSHVAKTRLWIIYPKAQAKRKAEIGLTQFFIREAALAVGLVDYKICSVNETWTGMLFTRKK